MNRAPVPRSKDFRSDNVAGVPPELLVAFAAANEGSAAAYGADHVTARLEARLSELFERTVAAFPVATGTAANVLALWSMVPQWGAVICHAEAHIATDECGAPEFFTGGKLIPLEGVHGKLTDAIVARELARDRRGVHHVQPAAVSLSQSTEAGTVYRPDEIEAIAAVARQHGVRVHMDGARLANAVASLGCSPAETSWKAGIDALSFGLTKNGAMAAEAVVFFDEGLARDFAFRRKKAGHLFSKMRFASAQIEAQLTDGLWLALATRANAAAARFASEVARMPDVRLLYPVEANEVFLVLPEPAIAALEAAGYLFYRWDSIEGPCIRLVTAWDSEPGHIDALVEDLRRVL